MKQGRKKAGLMKIFSGAKVNYPWAIPQQIGRQWDVTGMNIRLGRTFGPQGHRAVEEIRQAVIMLGAPPIPAMRFNDIPKGSSDWSDGQKALWKRFWLWQNMLKDEHKTRDATILFVKGHGLRDIEQTLRIRNGSAKIMLVRGVEIYIEILDLDGAKVADMVMTEQMRNLLLRNA